VFFLNTAAGGVAVTLDMADHLVLLDETTVPDDQEQVEDRIHRASRMHNVTIYYLRTRGTIEEEVAYIAAARQNVQKYLLDGARGVEYAKQVFMESRES
jgi:SNF2 family DNA or RNA helicase